MSVSPGTLVGSSSDFIVGEGVYERHGDIRASLLGHVSLEVIAPVNGNSAVTRINVVGVRPNAREKVISVGDIVICQVIRILSNQIVVDIVMIGDNELFHLPRGVIRLEDIRANDIDKIYIPDIFRVGDLVKAIVISLGDSKQYFLSTVGEQLGVCYRI